MTQLAALLKKLDAEVEEEATIAGFIDELQIFVDHREEEDIEGLENKLEYVGRKKEITLALRKKEIFQKRMIMYEHFSSAQKIYAIFLSKIHEVFEANIMNQGQTLKRAEVEDIIEEKIVKPIMADIDGCGGSDHIFINESHVRGMIFWLADRCWVRWH